MFRLLLLISCIFISSISFAEIKRIEDKTSEIIEALTELSKQLPQHYLSLDAVAEHNEYDEKKIIQWVKKNIQYSPSSGYQLTPEKSLHTATGNSLEQAILLQNILTNAGFEVRIAQSKLNETTATSLLKQSFHASPIKEWEMDADIRDKYLKKFAKLYGQPENALLEKYKELTALTPWKDSKLYKESAKLAQTFYDAIDKKGAWKIPDDPLKPWVEIAQDYYFIKYRLSQGDQWIQAHPAFVDNTPDIQQSSYFTEDIASQYHQITLQAFITRKTNDKTETIAVTPKIKRSSVELFEHQLTFSTVPSNFQEAMDKKSLELLYESEYFIPTVDGELLDNSKAFTLNGQDIDAKEILDPTQEFVKTTKDKTDKAGSALDNLGKSQIEEKKSENNVSSEFLDYYFEISWKAPNGDSRELKRIIYQRRDVETKKSIQNDISQRILLAAEPAFFSSVAQFSELLNMQISIYKMYKKIKQEGLSEIQGLSHVSKWYREYKDVRFNNTLELSQLKQDAHQFFSNPPMLAMIWERVEYDKHEISGTTAFDYLINASQIVKISKNMIIPDPFSTMAHGLWSTYSEALVQAKVLSGDTPLSREDFPQKVVSSAGQFNHTTMGGSMYVIIKNKNQLEKYTQLNESEKILLSEDLNNYPQNIYFLPTKRPNNHFLAFYRVDTQTGETLGYSEYGKGVSFSNRVVTTSIFVSLFLGAFHMGECLSGEKKGLKALGCTMCVLASTATGIITANPAAAAATTFSTAASGAGSFICDAAF